MTGPRASGPCAAIEAAPAALPAGASEPIPGDGARAPSGARTGNPGSIRATTRADPASARTGRAGAGVEAKPQIRSCRFPDMAPFPRNGRPGACSLPNRDMRTLHRLNRSGTFDPPRRTPPFGRAGGGRARGLPHRVSCRLLPAINGARQQKKMPFAGDSMPREHWAAGSATHSRRLNAMDRRCPACTGGRPDRAANCVDRPGTGDRLGERGRR